MFHKTGGMLNLPKRDDLTLCDNWHGIALLDVVEKVVGHLIQTSVWQSLS